MDELLEVHALLMDRYIAVLKNSNIRDKERHIKFCEVGKTLTNPDKLSRWVGFIQGILSAHNLLSVEEERSFSRKYYKPVYEKLGYDSTTIVV